MTKLEPNQTRPSEKIAADSPATPRRTGDFFKVEKMA